MRVLLLFGFLTSYLLSLSSLSLYFSGSEAQLKTYRRDCDLGKRIWEDQLSWDVSDLEKDNDSGKANDFGKVCDFRKVSDLEKISDLEKVGHLSLSATVKF